MISLLEYAEKILRALLGRQKNVRVEMLVIGSEENSGVIALPKDATIIAIVNFGTHGALDTCYINDAWIIPGGETRYLHFDFQEQDVTDWTVTWEETTVIDRKVLFIYKIPC